MLCYKDALKKLLTSVPQPERVPVSLYESLGRVAAESIVADLDLPPFDKSFMDGYALRTQDLQGGTRTLKVAGVVAAGDEPGVQAGTGEAWQIMTGAPVPRGADAVQMVEKTRRRGATIEILEPVAIGENIAPRGSEVKQGAVVIESGRVIGPAEIGVLASFGRNQVEVFRQLRLALASTGDELVDIEQKPRPGQIRNSNAHMLRAQCMALGLAPTILPIVRDQPEAIRKAVLSGLREHDALILSGGVSMGEFDFVPGMLREEGVEVFFHKAAIKPGKPLIVGRRGEQMVFGLPGNPVSAFVTFEVFARPALRKWMGFENLSLTTVKAQLAEAIQQKPGRLFFKPALTELVDGTFRTTGLETRGSADIVAFSKCNSMLLFPAEASEITAGQQVEVMLLEGRGGW